MWRIKATCETIMSTRDSKCELSAEEIAAAIDRDKFPPILNVDQAAALLQLSKHTVYRAVSEGRFRSAVRRNRPLRFWRDRLVATFMFGKSNR